MKFGETPSGPLELEVSSWRRVWRILPVENVMGGIVDFERGRWSCLSPWSFKLELEAKNGATKFALDKAMAKEELELLLSGGKDDW